MEFVPLVLLDSVESSEVSYPSVALSFNQVHITYTYKRAYIKSLVLNKSALVQQARQMLNAHKAQSSAQELESSSTSLPSLQILKKGEIIHTNTKKVDWSQTQVNCDFAAAKSYNGRDSNALACNNSPFLQKDAYNAQKVRDD